MADVIDGGLAHDETVLLVGSDGIHVTLVYLQDHTGITRLLRPLGHVSDQLPTDAATLHIRVPNNLTNYGTLVNDGTVIDDLDNVGDFLKLVASRERGREFGLPPWQPKVAAPIAPAAAPNTARIRITKIR